MKQKCKIYFEAGVLAYSFDGCIFPAHHKGCYFLHYKYRNGDTGVTLTKETGAGRLLADFIVLNDTRKARNETHN